MKLMVSKGLSRMFIRLIFLTFVITYYFLLINNTEIIYASTPTPSPPTVSDNPDPQQGGSDISFSCSGCSAASGETIKLFVCKSNDLRCILESEWSHKVPITIDNMQNSNSLTNYQVLVTVDTNSLISAGKMRDDCGDIRFFDPDNPTSYLNYWIESGCNSASTKIWIKVPSIPASSAKTIYMYYGNENASSESNASTVFECFSSFENTFDGWTPSKYETKTKYSTNDPTITTDWKYDGSYSARLHIGGDYSDIGAYSQIERTFTFSSSVNVSFFYRLYAGGGADGGDRANFRILVDNDVIYDSGQFGPANWDSGTLFRNFTVSSGTHTITFRLVETASGGGWTDHRYAYLDRIVIRKHTSPEPTVSIGSEQSTDSSSYLWTKSSTAVSSNPSATYTCPSCTYSTNTYYGVTYSVEEGVWTSFASSQTFTCKKENTCACSENSECYSGACKLDPDGIGEFCCNSDQCSHDGSCSTLVELASTGSSACIEGENIPHNSAGSSHPRYATYDGQLYYCGTDNTDKSPYAQVTNLIPGDAIGKCRCGFNGNFDCSSVPVIKGWKSRFRILAT